MVNHRDRDIWQLIQAFNHNRNPLILPRKYCKMRENAFVFYRGSCHLFYRDLPENLTIKPAPHVWICGDLHLENFGTYKGDDRQIYFGINDFDESALAPCTWDLARLLTSIFLALDTLSIDRSQDRSLAELYLHNYTQALSKGKIRAIVADNATGVVADLLETLHRRSRSELLDKYTTLTKNRRQLKFDDEKVLTVSSIKYEQVSRAIDRWAKTQSNPDFFEVLDVGYRIAGTGSVGLERYLILVTGKGSPDRNYLLDFKQQQHSSLEPYLTIPQPAWQNPATRIMEVQSLVQSAPPALMAAIEFNGSSYLLRELQPTQDKIALRTDKKKDKKPTEIGLADLEKLIETMANVTAFAHLHGSGKLGAANAQELITFSQNSDWQLEVLNYAINYAQQVRLDSQDFYRATQYLTSIEPRCEF